MYDLKIQKKIFFLAVLFSIVLYFYYNIDSYPYLKNITWKSILLNAYYYTFGNPLLLKMRMHFFYFLNFIYKFMNDQLEVDFEIDLYNKLLFEVNFLLFVEIYFIIFIILYLLSLTIWTRAAGPRYRLDQLLSVAFRAILPTLAIIIIILSGIL